MVVLLLRTEIAFAVCIFRNSDPACARNAKFGFSAASLPIGKCARLRTSEIERSDQRTQWMDVIIFVSSCRTIPTVGA